jgi:type II secretory pathway predicted ATPase ExeA
MPEPRTCPVCRQPFTPKHATAVYCSIACYNRAPYGVRPCEHCHESFPPRSPHQRFCSNRCRYTATGLRRRKSATVAPARPSRAKERPTHVDWEGVPVMRLLEADRIRLGYVRDPFEEEPRSADELFESAEIAATKAEILTAISTNSAIAVSAPVGSGKTILWQQIEEELGQSARTNYLVARIRSIDRETVDPGTIIRAVLEAVGQPWRNNDTMEALSIAAERVVRDRHDRRMRTVVVIDEAHRIPARALRSLKVLMDMKAGYQRMVSIVLLGQEELRARFADYEMREVAARIRLVTPGPLHVRGTDPRDFEVRRYIRHQICLALHDRPPLSEEEDVRLPFTDTGIAAIEDEFDPERKYHAPATFLAVRNLASNALAKAAELGLEAADEGIVREVRAAHIEGI